MVFMTCLPTMMMANWMQSSMRQPPGPHCNTGTLHTLHNLTNTIIENHPCLQHIKDIICEVESITSNELAYLFNLFIVSTCNMQEKNKKYSMLISTGKHQGMKTLGTQWCRQKNNIKTDLRERSCDNVKQKRKKERKCFSLNLYCPDLIPQLQGQACGF